MDLKAALFGTMWILFFVHFASSQSPSGVQAKEVIDCLSQCDAKYIKLNNESLSSMSLRSFVRSMACNFTAAADSTCRQVDTVYTCYQACVDTAISYGFAYSPSDDYSTTKRLKRVFCSTDNTNCRFMDSYYCEAIYNFRTCDQNLTRYIDCIGQVQLERGCSLTNNCLASQRVVQSKIFDSVTYCATAAVSALVSANSLNPAYAALQYCETTIRSICLASLAASTGDFSNYIAGNVTCEEYSRGIACIGSTTNGTFSLPSGLNVTAPCQLLPNSALALKSIMDQVKTMQPASCRSAACGNVLTANTPSAWGSTSEVYSAYSMCLSSLNITAGSTRSTTSPQPPDVGMSSGAFRNPHVSCFSMLVVLFILTIS